MTSRPGETTKKSEDSSDIPARVADLHARGLSQRATATALGITRHAVRTIANELGLNYSAEITAKATAASQAQTRLQNAALLARWQDIANEQLEQAGEIGDTPLKAWNRIRIAAVATDKAVALSKLEREYTRDLFEQGVHERLSPVLAAMHQAQMIDTLNLPHEMAERIEQDIDNPHITTEE